MSSAMAPPPLGWLGIVRLGLVQTGLGAVVVLTTATLNRVMVVELALPAMLPGALVGVHYAMQMLRPRMGYGSDMGGRRTPWILGGMAVLATGGLLASMAVALMAANTFAGLALALLAFMLIGLGSGAAGTTLLVLMAKRVAPARRATAATIVWVMMIVGFIVTAATAGALLDPFSPTRLVLVTGAISLAAFLLAALAVRGMEGKRAGQWDIGAESAAADETAARVPFRTALRQIWGEPGVRRFAVFVFLSMLAYSAQDLIIEPFAGLAYDMTPGETTSLAALQYTGVLIGMIAVAVLGARVGAGRAAALRRWTMGGCIGSALGLFALFAAGLVGPAWPLKPTLVLLGVANGAFAVAAIGTMMAMAGHGQPAREGVRMGVWGAAQAVAFGIGGFLGASAVDLLSLVLGAAVPAYALVFAGEAILFLVAAGLVLGLDDTTETAAAPHPETAAAAL